jgi:hypothetical protein
MWLCLLFKDTMVRRQLMNHGTLAADRDATVAATGYAHSVHGARPKAMLHALITD